MVMALPGPEAPFAQRRQVGVVANLCGYTEALRQFRANRKVFPAGNVRRGKDYAGFRVKRPRQGYNDLFHGAVLRPDGLDQRADALEGRLFTLSGGALHGFRRGTPAPKSRRADLSPTDVH